MAVTAIQRQDVFASIWFLVEKELYKTVKPYTLAFTPAPEVNMPRDNIERKEVSVNISDLRGSEELLSLDNNGFMVLSFQNEHSVIDWESETMVKDVHYPEVVSEVKNAFPDAHCHALHHQVS